MLEQNSSGNWFVSELYIKKNDSSLSLSLSLSLKDIVGHRKRQHAFLKNAKNQTTRVLSEDLGHTGRLCKVFAVAL